MEPTERRAEPVAENGELSLTGRQERFVAAFLGEARGIGTVAARMAGYAHPTVEASRLLTIPKVRAKIATATAEVRREGIALKQVRVDKLVRRSALMDRVVDERAERYRTKDDAADAAGRAALAVLGHEVPAEAATGLLAEKQTVAANGRVVTEWSVDVGLLREMRETERQVAQELGEWDEGAPAAGVDMRLYVAVDIDRV